MRNSVLYHALAPYPSGSLRDVDSIGGVTKSRAVNPPRWLVWAGGSLLITAREQIRGRTNVTPSAPEGSRPMLGAVEIVLPTAN